jgi:hypothetical protein
MTQLECDISTLPEVGTKAIDDAKAPVRQVNNMVRPILLYIIAFVLAFLCFAAVKWFVMVFVAYFYGGGYGWGTQDTRFIFAQRRVARVCVLRLRNGGLCTKERIRVSNDSLAR